LAKLSKEEIAEISNGNGKTRKYTTRISPIHLLAANGHDEVLDYLITYSPDLLLVPGTATAMHQAARRNHAACLKVLIAHHVPIDIPDEDFGFYPLHVAAYHCHPQVISVLLDCGADVKAVDPRGYTALSVASMSVGDTTCMKMLLAAGSEIEATSKTGETPLYLASQSGLPAAVQFLLENNANVHFRSDTGYTALHVAAWGGHELVLRVLLEFGADVDAGDELGNTALMVALDHVECVSLLTAKGATIDLRNKSGKTALFLALERRLVEVAKKLISCGADVWAKDDEGKCAMDLDLAENEELILDAVKTQTEKNNSANALVYKEAIALFNQKASQGIDFLMKSGILKNPPSDLAWLFTNFNNQLSKIQLGTFLGGEEDLNISTLKAFTNRMNFAGMPFDKALRHYLQFFMLPGEAQKIDRMMEAFAIRYHENNAGVFPDADSAFILAFSLIILNTDHHNPSIKVKMSREEFLRNNRGQWGPDHVDPPRDLLIRLYEAISTEEIEFEREGYVFGGAERKGYLKKFSPPTTWTKRYFILKDSCLYYFKNQKESEQPHGIIVLENLAVTKQARRQFVLSAKDGLVKYCKMSSAGVMVQGTQREIVFFAESESVRDEWVNSLLSSIAENPFYDLISRRVAQLAPSSTTSDPIVTSNNVQGFLEWIDMCKMLDDEKEMKERWGDQLSFCDTSEDLKYALIEEGKGHKIILSQYLFTPSFLEHLRHTKSTKFDFMKHFQIGPLVAKITKNITPYLRKYHPTQICGYGLGSIVAIHVGLKLQADNYLVSDVLTLGQPNIVSSKDFPACGLLGITRILLPQDPALALFENHAHAGKQLILGGKNKAELENVPNFAQQLSLTVKFPKVLCKKDSHLYSKFCLVAYEKALLSLKL